MTSVIYWAYHWYDENERTLKTIGFFSDESKAQAAVDAVRCKPGFRDYPDGFVIDRSRVDVVTWQDGFGFDY